MSRKKPCTQAELQRARRKSLWIGQWMALLGIVFWIAAGIIYPVGLTQLEIPTQEYAFPHFLLSMILSGLIAASYPFLIITLISVRVFYPLLAPLTPDAASDREAMQSVARWAGIHLIAAGGVPLLSVAALSFLELAGVPNSNRAIPAAICLAGMAGLAFAFWMYRVLLRSLEVLQQVNSATSRFLDTGDLSGEYATPPPSAQS